LTCAAIDLNIFFDKAAKLNAIETEHQAIANGHLSKAMEYVGKA